MMTILITVGAFAAVMFLLSVGLIFSKSTRLKKSCSGGMGPTRIDDHGNHATCGTCHCSAPQAKSLSKLLEGTEVAGKTENDPSL